MIKEKILNREAVIGVIGLGYVGLPLAVEKAKAGFKVIGFDIQERKIQMVNEGHNYIGDVVNEDLERIVKEGKLRATTDFDELRNCDVAAICVPTPLDKYKQPDLTYVVNSTKEVAKRLHKDMLVVLESTTYPGTTEEVMKPILEETGLKCGEDFYLAFSPERVDPGNLRYKTKNTPKVVGGVGKESTEVARLLYESVLEAEVFVVSSPKEAEMTKILENTFRIVNIALANEMAIIADKMGISIWEVISAASTKPFGFMPFYPGPGVGGHCIPIDPFYLTYIARKYDYHTRLIEMAGEINDFMPEYVVDRLMKQLNERKKCMNGAKIIMLGIAYKGDIDDMRESPALKVLEQLEKNHADVTVVDPYVEEFRWNGEVRKTAELSAELIKEADAVVITTAHKHKVNYQFVVDNAKLVFDTKNILKSLGIAGENVEVL
ncbi:UDP-N-acetyl-D-glucosamine dehydrogenase [Kosmotoga arenicorallina S304]|uniref:UDP-N-acetyl-D-glucosamine dehydrogenase n=1 Tax=Kosmotoga arenicorallina S304 TaxID=1453497 RepID=A0A176JTI8_9BACT|nr:nucleotide sugar dehydrogenase [Kosmotoga arenicorallina]OAA26584.1 UDP-N-acetyl-D-glucosamine dehydrogenase [Kosmotoga arenicorallina S304]